MHDHNGTFTYLARAASRTGSVRAQQGAQYARAAATPRWFACRLTALGGPRRCLLALAGCGGSWVVWRTQQGRGRARRPRGSVWAGGAGWFLMRGACGRPARATDVTGPCDQ
eukprot:scaffold606_cov115-Isochrysis_galbana.AAC.3